MAGRSRRRGALIITTAIRLPTALPPPFCAAEVRSSIVKAKKSPTRFSLGELQNVSPYALKNYGALEAPAIATKRERLRVALALLRSNARRFTRELQAKAEAARFARRSGPDNACHWVALPLKSNPQASFLYLETARPEPENWPRNKCQKCKKMASPPHKKKTARSFSSYSKRATHLQFG